MLLIPHTRDVTLLILHTLVDVTLLMPHEVMPNDDATRGDAMISDQNNVLCWCCMVCLYLMPAMCHAMRLNNKTASVKAVQPSPPVPFCHSLPSPVHLSPAHPYLTYPLPLP